MTTISHQAPIDYLAVADELVDTFSLTAVERDIKGGTAKAERDLIRRSGLLALLVPKSFGGCGDTWLTVLEIVRRFARVDSSIAHLFGYHFLNLVTPHMYGTEEQKRRYYMETANKPLFWGNAFNPLDQRLVAVREGDRYYLSGTKRFCSGATDSDLLLVSAKHEEGNGPLIAVIPTRREGVNVLNDWDNMGQRQTDSGGIEFSRVPVELGEVLDTPGPVGTEFSKLRSSISQIILTHVYLGIAEGAFEQAKLYTASSARAWPASGVSSAAQDPYFLRHYGDMWVRLEAARVLVERAARDFQSAWEKEWGLTERERGECMMSIATAKVMTTQVGLDITSRMFEVMGSRATSSEYRYDRFWRNLRTHTLHDPVEYKLKELGNWALNGQFPQSSSFF
ncbi:acyl-CoA dehydrogenase family protein [Paenibacillus naphthalenovorans]|nr:acyl-CoA dehydrogenase family protein [Paenibacillus naphthalenovorans]SDI82907.1 Acyl-CoA dehydrogenase [Paenibacillus naphthalenovorans]